MIVTEIESSFREKITLDFCSFEIVSAKRATLEPGDDEKKCVQQLFQSCFTDVQASIREKREDVYRIVEGAERKKLIAPKSADI